MEGKKGLEMAHEAGKEDGKILYMYLYIERERTLELNKAAHPKNRSFQKITLI